MTDPIECSWCQKTHLQTHLMAGSSAMICGNCLEVITGWLGDTAIYESTPLPRSYLAEYLGVKT